MNTVPYTNARRAGRTRPDVVEMINEDDPRHRSRQGVVLSGRAGRRARGLYRGATWSQVPRHHDRKSHGKQARS